MKGGLDIGAEMAALRSALESEAAREAEAEERLAAVLRANADLPRQLSLTLGRLRTKLALVESDAAQVCGSLEVTAALADSVSGKVRELDLAKGRVVDCLQRLEDLQDLKLCTQGVTAALGQEDFEVAAGHVQRFLSLEKALFAGGSTDAAQSADLAESYRILNSAREELSRLVQAKFLEAQKEADVGSMQRFLKLFPQLGQHRLGIDHFGSYLRGAVAQVAEKNLETVKRGGEDGSRSNVLFADGLTLLFEGIARILEQNLPIVQASYGAEWSLALVKILQEECDLQADLIISEFMSRRKYASQAKLVETFARQASRAGEKIDPLQLDVLLSEVTLLHTRGELYLRFLRRKVGADVASLPDAHPDKAALQDQLADLQRSSGLGRSMQELIGHYISMELYYMEESVRKAMEMDSVEGGTGLTSSMVEDVFFVVRKSVRRSLSSGSVDCVCAMLNNASTLLETALTGELRAQLKEGYPVSGSVAEAVLSVSVSYSNVMAGGKVAGGPQSEGQKGRHKFLLALNNAAASETCVKQLRSALEAEVRQHLGEGEAVRAKVEHSLSLLGDVGQRLRDVAKGGVDVLVTAALKPRIRQELEAFLDYAHSPSDEEFQDFEVNDPWVERFLGVVDESLESLKRVLAESCYADLVGGTASEVGRQLEKALRKTRLNRLGALQLDKEVRSLVAYLSDVGGWAVRERLGRLSAVAALLNAESVGEARDFLASSHAPLPLSDAKALLQLRTDFSLQDIRKITY